MVHRKVGKEGRMVRRVYIGAYPNPASQWENHESGGMFSGTRGTPKKTTQQPKKQFNTS